MEKIEDFRRRAKKWLAENMPRLPEHASSEIDFDAPAWDESRTLQRKLFEGGFAGLCYPREYGGQGLPKEYQDVFNEECAGYQMPLHLNITTLSICGPTILEMGSDHLKRKHIPSILRGEEVIVQFLSESCGGSDLAGIRTRAERRDDAFIVNGSKVWTSYAYAADIALCLVRTNWDVPKHRGLTMLIMDVRAKGLRMSPIRQVNRNTEFCEEFFEDVAVPVENVVGEIDRGWEVAIRLLYHERNAVGGNSPYSSGITEGPRTDVGQFAPSLSQLLDMAERTGRSRDPYVRELIGESHILSTVHEALAKRVGERMRAGAMPEIAGSLIRLFSAISAVRRTDIGLEIAGSCATAYDDELGKMFGEGFLMRQTSCLGGGSSEMSRNIISERLLNMPREHAPDKDLPFKELIKLTAKQ